MFIYTALTVAQVCLRISVLVLKKCLTFVTKSQFLKVSSVRLVRYPVKANSFWCFCLDSLREKFQERKQYMLTFIHRSDYNFSENILLKLVLAISTRSFKMMHSERPKSYTVLAFLSAIGLKYFACFVQHNNFELKISVEHLCVYPSII